MILFEVLRETTLVSIRSDVYKEWKARYTRVVKGLTADGNVLGGAEDHRPPIYLGKVDPTDHEAVERSITAFEAENRKLEYEKALVITADGDIYECYGTEQEVYPNVDLGERIRGATITHNHPAAYTEYSFSKEDCALFEEYDLQVLRGIDEKYIYELSRRHEEVEELKSIFDIVSSDEGQHETVKGWASERGYGYSRRSLND